MNFRDTIGYEGEAIPSADTPPAVTHSLMQITKATMGRIGVTVSGGPTVHSQLSSILANISGGLQGNLSGLMAQVSAAWWGLQTNVSGLATLQNVSAVVAANETAMKLWTSGIVPQVSSVQQVLGYGARLLTEDTGGSKSVIVAGEITESAGWWRGSLVMGLTGHNIGVPRVVIRNSSGSVEVAPDFPETNASDDTYMLITALKPQIQESQASEPISLFLSGGAAEANVLNLSTSGYSYRVDHLRVKSENPLAQTVSIKLYELVNGASTQVVSFSLTSGVHASYLSLMDMFGVPHLAGDNLKVTAACTSGATSGVNLTGQYSYSKVYTGAG